MGQFSFFWIPDSRQPWRTAKGTYAYICLATRHRHSRPSGLEQGNCIDPVLGMRYFVGQPGEWKTYPSLCLKPKNFRSVGTYSESFPDALVGTKT